jgi:hypothetical protein
MKSLHYKHLLCKELDQTELDSMLKLMQENYTDISREQFLNDLSQKEYAGLLYDCNNCVQGFTTYAVNPNQSGSFNYAVLFSGDTIISPEYWGTIELIRGWCYSVAHIMKTHPEKTWYWFLLSKGHRTFMYLPLFFESYYPQMDGEQEQQSFLFEMLEELAGKIYPNLYEKGSGIIRFPYQGGELKEDLAKGTFDKASKKQVKWFIQNNPNFFKGDELICLCKIDPKNMRGFAKKFLSNHLAKYEF